MSEKNRTKVINRETLVVLGLYLTFFIWWYVTAYCLGSGPPSNYRYIFGFPEWFFYSCIVGYIGISILLWLAVRLFFTEIPFEDEEKNYD